MTLQAAEPMTTSISRVRPGFLKVAILILAAALSVPATMVVIELRRDQGTLAMRELATRIPVPAGLTTLSRGECPSQDALVACWTTSRPPDDVTATFTAALRGVTGGRARTRCDTWPPSRIRQQSCDISYGHGDHTVSISVMTATDRRQGRTVAVGSRIRMDAT